MLIDINKLGVGILFPIEAYEGAIPKMENQVKLAQLAQVNGFDTLWVRDVPLYDPDFRDMGQIFDPWVYMSHIASLTQNIKIGAASMVLPLRHPIHFAKAAASLDVLFPNRLHLGVASGDRVLEYPAFNKPYEFRSTNFMRQVEVIREFWRTDFPTYNNDFGKLSGEADVLPKPNRGNIPMYITGHAGGINIDWIAQNGDGWIYYPREFSYTKNILKNWHETLDMYQLPKKPYIQPLYLDLVENPDAEPQVMELGFRLGRNYMIDLLLSLKELGVNHTIFVPKFCTRPMEEILEEIGKEVIPHVNR